MLAFLEFLSWQSATCPFVSRVSQIAHSHRNITLPAPLSCIYSFFRALLLMLTGFSVTFLLTTPKSIFLSVPTDPVLAVPLLGLIAFVTFWVWIDSIKLPQAEVQLKKLSQCVCLYFCIFFVCISFISVFLFFPLTLVDAAKSLVISCKICD